MREERQPGVMKPKTTRVEVYWTTVSYRTVFLYITLLFFIVLVTLYLVYPDSYSASFRRLSTALSGRTTAVGALSQNQARFVNLDGKVQVKKVNSVQWAPADYRTTLDKGDLIETGPDGAARLTFVDGTTYTVKTDTLVTVEENSVTPERATRVGVHISSGAVDLTTGTWESPASKAEVSFENAVASLRQNSRAAVRSDPSKNEHEITVAAGSAELQRGDERVEIARWEKAAFPTNGPVTKTNVLAPPDPAAPVNLQPLIVPEPRRASVRFEWKPVVGAVAYQLRVSTTAMFAKVVAERRSTGTTTEVTGLDAGDYFWDVIAVDAHKRSSEPSETYKFTLVAQGKGQEMLLEIEGTQLHGNVVEVIGRTEPGAALIVNGEPVANLQPDGHFRHFIESMARGSQTIVITGQNRRGGTVIKRVPIVIP
ncbi:MAG TPA: FecR domain-containing protein [Candidatus Acidoferrales bacterium]|nr:FecR domain-containing protein [Candidatus Acidoferrales bacterium]